ncbi:MAG: AsmA family protein [Deltaproteobacteria bacterium]|nr:MAG: AsmA family protein [Deltaproteobacteria bacterium]
MKRVLAVLGILAVLLVLAGVAIVLLVDVNAHKPRIEAAVSDALGMEFRILGRAALRLTPSASISLSDVRLRNRGTDLATAEALRVGVLLRPLLRREVVVTEVVLEKPVLRIEKGTDGKFNYETDPRPAKPPSGEGAAAGAPLAVASGSVRNGSFVYVDRKDGTKTEISGVELSVRDLSIPADSGTPLATGVSFTGTLRLKELAAKDLSVSDVAATVSASGGIYDIRPFTMKLFGGRGEGGIRVDLSKEKADVEVKYALSEFRAEESLAAVSGKKFLSGPLTIEPDLSFHGKGAAEMKRTLRGRLSLRGEGLTLHGMDVDAVLSKVEEAQKMNLADVGAFLLAGPLGSAAVKGYRFGGVYGSAAREGESRVTRLVSDWTVRDGVAVARDVAFSTPRNRIALTGRLDLVNERFVDVTVAVLDAKGCAKVRQKISGPFGDPTVDKVSVIQSAAASVLGLFERAKRLIGASRCEPFYMGSVPHPG